MYTCMYICVCMYACICISSNSSTVTSGVPQGTVLPPLLFLCFVNDIPHLDSSKIRLYADDILLYSIINSNEDCISLQNDINKLNLV